MTLLHEHAPGLGPEPISAALDADPPVIVMSRVRGESLGTRRAAPEQLDALAAALDHMHFAIPAHVLDEVEPYDTPSSISALLRAMVAKRAAPNGHGGAEPVVCEAYEAARDFIDSDWIERAACLKSRRRIF